MRGSVGSHDRASRTRYRAAFSDMRRSVDLLHWHDVSLDARDLAGPLEEIQAALLVYTTDLNNS
ncbi:hypothetical protein BGV49_21125 [Burkholderia ubonensis]|nr:hypothetical protein BGV49_21125 [Burkholderia ubonensis]